MPINSSLISEFSKLKDALDNFQRGNYSNEHTSKIVVERCTNMLQHLSKKPKEEPFLEDLKKKKKVGNPTGVNRYAR